MTQLPIIDAIPRFQVNENNVDILVNGNANASYTTSNGVVVPSFLQFQAQQANVINIFVNNVYSTVLVVANSVSNTANVAKAYANAAANSAAIALAAQANTISARDATLAVALNASDFATQTQGAKADTAVQPNVGNIFSATQIVSSGNSSFNGSFLSLKPTDFGAGKPGVFFNKDTIANSWSLGLSDGAGGTGIFNIVATTTNVQNLSANNLTLSTPLATTQGGTGTSNVASLLTSLGGATTGVNLFSNTQTISVGNSVYNYTYLALKPTDYGTGKPEFFINKDATANSWSLGIFDGGTSTGILNINASNTVFSGSIWASSSIRVTGEVQTIAPNSYRNVQGNYGTFWRNDGTSQYLMITASGDQYGTYNALRPFYVSLSTGAAYIGNSLTVQGGASISNGMIVSGFTQFQGAADTTSVNYLRMVPSNYSNGHSFFYLDNSGVNSWTIGAYDGAGNTGKTLSVASDILNLTAANTNVNGLLNIGNGAHFGSQLGNTAFDVSKHIDLYSGQYGFNVTASALNAAVPLGAGYNFYVGNTNSFSVGASGINVNSANTAATKFVFFNTASSNRWVVGANGVAESGNNVGTNFVIRRFSDAGTAIDSPLTIQRVDGSATFSNSVSTPYLYLSTPTVAAGKFVQIMSGGNSRWTFGADADGAGNNVGANFVWYRYSDAGAYIDTPMYLSRISGQLNLSQNLIVGAATLQTNGDVYMPWANNYLSSVMVSTKTGGTINGQLVLSRISGASGELRVGTSANNSFRFIRDALDTNTGNLLLQQSTDGFVNNTTNAMLVSPAGNINFYQSISSGGNIAATAALSGAALNLNNTVAGGSTIQLLANGLNRWAIQRGGGTETGNNVASDFYVHRYNDDGSYIGATFSISRATGIASFTTTPTYPTPAVGDNSTSGATTAFVTRAVGASGGVAKTGDTMTGSLVLPSLLVDGAAQSNRNIYWTTAGVSRWIMGMANGAESGNNVGTDLFLNRYADDGTFLDTSLSINRATGNVSIGGNNAGGVILQGAVPPTSPGGFKWIRCINLATGTNFNTITDAGVYDCSAPVGAPTTTDWWYLEVIRHSQQATYVMQRATLLTANGPGLVPVTWQRQAMGAGFTAWAPQSGFVTPEHYNAYGNASNDDTAAVTSALRSGFPVHLRGQYNITSNIGFGTGYSDGYCHILGEGRTHFLLTSASAGLAFNNPANGYYGGAAAAQLTIKDVNMLVSVGNHATAALNVNGAVGGSGSVAKTFDIDNVQVYGNTAGAAALIGINVTNGRNGVIRGCTVQGRRSEAGGSRTTTGINVNGASDPVDFTIENCHTYFNHIGIQLSGTIEGATIDKNTAVACDYGIYAQLDANPIGSPNEGKPLVKITNNHTNAYNIGICCIRVRDLIVTGNDCLSEAGYASWNGIYSITQGNASQYGWFDGNKIQDAVGGTTKAGTYGIFLDGYSAGTGALNTLVGLNRYVSVSAGLVLNANARLVKWDNNSIYAACTNLVINNGTSNAAF